MDVSSGVPQRSVLGPFLFLIFIKDIDEGLLSHILKFADDAKIFHSVSNKQDHERLQDDLNSVVTWFRNWQMEFNTTKCKVLHVGESNQHFQYVMDNQTDRKSVV